MGVAAELRSRCGVQLQLIANTLLHHACCACHAMQCHVAAALHTDWLPASTPDPIHALLSNAYGLRAKGKLSNHPIILLDCSAVQVELA